MEYRATKQNLICCMAPHHYRNNYHGNNHYYNVTIATTYNRSYFFWGGGGIIINNINVVFNCINQNWSKVNCYEHLTVQNIRKYLQCCYLKLVLCFTI